MSSCERILFNIVCQTANLLFTASFFCDEILSFLLNSSYPFTFPCAVPSSPLGYFSSFPLAVSLWHREGEERKRGCVCLGGGLLSIKPSDWENASANIPCLSSISASLSFSLSSCPSLPCTHSLTSSSLPLCCLCHLSFSHYRVQTLSTRQWDRLLGRVCESFCMHARACVRERMRVTEIERMWDLCESAFLPAHRIQWASLASQARTELGKRMRACACGSLSPSDTPQHTWDPRAWRLSPGTPCTPLSVSLSVVSFSPAVTISTPGRPTLAAQPLPRLSLGRKTLVAGRRRGHASAGAGGAHPRAGQLREQWQQPLRDAWHLSNGVRPVPEQGHQHGHRQHRLFCAGRGRGSGRPQQHASTLYAPPGATGEAGPARQTRTSRATRGARAPGSNGAPGGPGGQGTKRGSGSGQWWSYQHGYIQHAPTGGFLRGTEEPTRGLWDPQVRRRGHQPRQQLWWHFGQVHMQCAGHVFLHLPRPDERRWRNQHVGWPVQERTGECQIVPLCIKVICEKKKFMLKTYYNTLCIM